MAADVEAAMGGVAQVLPRCAAPPLLSPLPTLLPLLSPLPTFCPSSLPLLFHWQPHARSPASRLFSALFIRWAGT